jgi:hypothetical protein
MGVAYRVPGVYIERRPRVAPTPIARTDVVGFVGLEPRVRDGSTPSALVGSPPVGHSFQVDVSAFELVVGSVRRVVPGATNLTLSANAATVPLAAGASRVYTVVAAQAAAGVALDLVVVAGAAASTGSERAPDDAQLNAAVNPLPASRRAWQRIADVLIRRDAASLGVTVLPSLGPVKCDDWRDYLLAFGDPRDDGTFLASSVRAYFANGGNRCWIATVRRPLFDDAVELARTRTDIVGTPGTSEVDATGLERLLLLEEVTAVDVPDLYARRQERTTRQLTLAPPERDACFLPCDRAVQGGAVVEVLGDPATAPLFDSMPLYAGGAASPLFDTQRALLARCAATRWRMLLLLSVPEMPDAATGRYLPPAASDAERWVAQFDHLVQMDGFAEPEEMSCAALYWPWLLTQEMIGAPTLTVPPGAYAAGVLARRDLARGPGVSPANEMLRQVVGVAARIDDEVHGALAMPEPGALGISGASVNIIRAFPGYGLQLYGARTLSTDKWLRFLSVRRTLTAIELRMRAALAPLVFEPNTPTLWMHVATMALGVLVPLFEDGMLRGERPEEAFYVRCDESVNPAESIAEGRFVVELGVAVAAPAEFLVFRLGRSEGVVEVLE